MPCNKCVCRALSALQQVCVLCNKCVCRATSVCGVQQVCVPWFMCLFNFHVYVYIFVSLLN